MFKHLNLKQKIRDFVGNAEAEVFFWLFKISFAITTGIFFPVLVWTFMKHYQ